MKRRLFNIVSLASLLLCVATAALWIRSYWVYDAFNWERPGPQLPYRFSMIISQRGVLAYSREDRNSPGWPPKRGYFEYWNGIHGMSSQARPRPPVTRLDVGIFRFYRSSLDFGFAVPDAGPVLLASICPAIWLTRLVRQRRIGAKDHCRVCGYDLRATPDRCPECGIQAQKAGA